MSELRFRDLHTHDEFRQVMDLEARVWGFTDLNDMVTVPVFTITVKRGAILIGAYDAGDRMVGFVYSIVGMKPPRQLLQWSHMLGVLPEYRNSGLGRALKLAQRDKALAQGYELVEWTYDPLQAMNAHLNFTKLGVVAERRAPRRARQRHPGHGRRSGRRRATQHDADVGAVAGQQRRLPDPGRPSTDARDPDGLHRDAARGAGAGARVADADARDLRDLLPHGLPGGRLRA
jgi:GNAT superfamily N-acetyltransferase